MKVIIAGTRTITDIELIEQAIAESNFDITEVVCGEAKGVDTLGKQWAESHNIPLASFSSRLE